MKKLLLIATALMFVAGSAAAEGFTVRLDAGAGFPMSPDDFKDGSDLGVAFGGSLSGPITGALGWRGEVTFNNFGCALDNCDISTRVTGFRGGVELGSTSDSKANFYGFVTAGMDRLSLSEGDFDAQSEFGMAFGAGTDISMGEGWGVNLEARVDGMFPGDDADTIWWITPTGGIYFEF